MVSPQRAKLGEMVLLQRGASSKVGGMVFASARCLLQGWRDGVCLSAEPPPRLEGWLLPQRGVSSKAGGMVWPQRAKLGAMVLLQRGASSKVGGMVFASARCLLQGWRDGFCLSAESPPRLEGWFGRSAASPPRLEGWFRLSAPNSERWFCFSAAPPPRLEGWCLPQRGASSKVGGMVFASARSLLQGWRDGFCRSAASPPRLEGWFGRSAASP